MLKTASVRTSRMDVLYSRQGATPRIVGQPESWRTACDALGLEGALFHDLRRTALTNMIEAGFSEKEAMEISGHKTRNVFDRYHIVSSKRQKQLGERLERHLQAKNAQLGERRGSGSSGVN